MFFEGRMIKSDDLPWYYVIKYIFLSVPPFTLLFASVGVVSCLWLNIKKKLSREYFLYLFTLMWFFTPVAYFIVIRPNIYDEIRHFMFIMPAVAVFAGIGAIGAYNLFNTEKSRKIFFVILVVISLLPARSILRLHPYQMSYFNIFAGGLAGADRYYETDYWVSSYKEAMEWVVEHVPENQKVSVLMAGFPHMRLCAGYFASRNISLTVTSDIRVPGNLPEGVDFYIATYRYGWLNNFPDAKIAYTIGKDGAIFTIIKARG